MDKKTMGDWIMYHEVQRLSREGLSCQAIALAVGKNRRTVAKYMAMTEASYEAFLEKKECRDKLLSGYESFVKGRLVAHPAATAAQVHDWLKEHHKDFPLTSAKTVYNFVMAVRQKYSITLEEPGREFFVVDELPYGLQAQADFGQYILRNAEEKRKKVHFFVMMLARSRMKFVQFSDSPFTTITAVDAHEAAFKFFCGIPQEVVYDQDRLFLVDENIGELLLTKDFKNYVFEQAFSVHFCRKADPQSKGKVENVVKFVKNNFLYGRPYYDIDTLQSQVLGWLQRTGNGMPHTTIRKVPEQEWFLEKPYLTPWVSITILPSYITRNVHIDNIISFKGNTYSVPQGTYKKNTAVLIWLKDDELHIHDDQRNFLCKHPIAQTKGNKVINTDHKRDKSTKLKALVADIAGLFFNPALAAQYFEMIRQVKPRYLRDQVQAIRDRVKGCDRQLVNIVLEKCVQERYLGATVFSELLAMHLLENAACESPMGKIILLDPGNTAKAEIQPAKRNLGDYDQLF